jgi:hypothetical protein
MRYTQAGISTMAMARFSCMSVLRGKPDRLSRVFLHMLIARALRCGLCQGRCAFI